MKKEIVRFSLLFVLVLLCTACNGDVTRDLRHDGFTVSSKFECDFFYQKDKNDLGYKSIKYLTGKNIIDRDGRIYEVSLEQVYANKMNCKRANTDLVVKSIFDNKVIKATNNKYYYLVGENSVASYSEIPATDNSYELYNILLKENDVVKIVTADSSLGIYYVLKSDGNIYSYTINRANYNSPLKVTTISIKYDGSDYGGKIIDFNYAGDSNNTFIRTDSKIYRMKAINYDRCSKYADVDCVYSLKEDEVLEKYKDKIIVFNGNVLITDYHQVFVVSN